MSYKPVYSAFQLHPDIQAVALPMLLVFLFPDSVRRVRTVPRESAHPCLVFPTHSPILFD